MNPIQQNSLKHSRRHVDATRWTNQCGFTLLELLLVISLIGILAMVSVGRYNRHVQESNRRAAVAQLYALQQTMERKRLESGTYSAIATQTIKGYIISSTSNSAVEYVLSATPVESDGGDMACGILTINQQDRRTASVESSADCWQ